MGRLLQGLAMLGDIEAFHLLLLRHPERYEDADELEQDDNDPNDPFCGICGKDGDLFCCDGVCAEVRDHRRH